MPSRFQHGSKTSLFTLGCFFYAKCKCWQRYVIRRLISNLLVLDCIYKWLPIFEMLILKKFKQNLWGNTKFRSWHEGIILLIGKFLLINLNGHFLAISNFQSPTSKPSVLSSYDHLNGGNFGHFSVGERRTILKTHWHFWLIRKGKLGLKLYGSKLQYCKSNCKNSNNCLGVYLNNYQSGEKGSAIIRGYIVGSWKTQEITFP